MPTDRVQIRGTLYRRVGIRAMHLRALHAAARLSLMGMLCRLRLLVVRVITHSYVIVRRRVSNTPNEPELYPRYERVLLS